MSRGQFLVALLFIGGAIITQIYWLYSPYLAGQKAQESLQSDYNVKFKKGDNFLVFAPKNSLYKNGIILFPDEYVEISAYAHIANKLAREGNLVILKDQNKKAFHNFLKTLPIVYKWADNFTPNIQKIIDDEGEFSNINNWFLGGHGIGGEIAMLKAQEVLTQFSKPLRKKVKGIILMAGKPITHWVDQSSWYHQQSHNVQYVTQNPLPEGSQLCSLYFTYNRQYNQGPIKRSFEEGAIDQLSETNLIIVNTEYDYHQFADYKLRTEQNDDVLIKKINSFVDDCLSGNIISKVKNQSSQKKKKKEENNNKEIKMNKCD